MCITLLITFIMNSTSVDNHYPHLYYSTFVCYLDELLSFLSLCVEKRTFLTSVIYIF